MKNKLLFILIYGFILGSCNRVENDGTIKVDEININKIGNHTSKDWQCFNAQYDRICCPISWKIINQHKRLFLVAINANDTNEFFSVVRYDKKINSISTNDYLRAYYSQIYYDSVEVLKTYTFKQLNFKDKTSYYGEFETEINNQNYYSFVMIIDYKGILYDLVMKKHFKMQDKKENYQIFEDILFNYLANKENIMSVKDKLLSFKEMDLAKI